MSKSNIIVRTRYKHSLTASTHVANWVSYVSKKEKADSTSLDEKNILGEYYALADKESFLFEKCESFVWGQDGDVNPKQDLNKIDDKGFVWNLVISFPPDFALNNGLITKSDYYDLTKNIMPSLITDMGLNLNNTIWYASLHRNTGNPHLHILLCEKDKTATKGFIPQHSIQNIKSNIGNYLIDNTKFYELRDKEFSNITGNISLKELTKVQGQKLYSDRFRKDLNKMLLDFYDKLPPKGRLQYNSKNIDMYRTELDNIIHYILLHDSVKYQYANYLKLLDKHQLELNQLYGITKDNKNKKYYNDQRNRLYSKIGNEILSNYKKYQSMNLIEQEKSFLEKHIKELKFKSRNDYAKDETKMSIAKDLYKLCMMANLNYEETKKVFQRWLKNSNYNYSIDAIMSSVSTLDYEMSSTEYYNVLKKLGYDYERYNKVKNKYFYKELNYKRFINKAHEHLMYELENEEKQIIAEMQYQLFSK
ncbi:MAG: hypothetical protein J6B98_06265 [Bacilli bacterium]|nr:hypothetical protein [Bacilli bacterium]